MPTFPLGNKGGTDLTTRGKGQWKRARREGKGGGLGLGGRGVGRGLAVEMGERGNLLETLLFSSSYKFFPKNPKVGKLVLKVGWLLVSNKG